MTNILAGECRGAYKVWTYALLILLQTVVLATFFVILQFLYLWRVAEIPNTVQNLLESLTTTQKNYTDFVINCQNAKMILDPLALKYHILGQKRQMFCLVTNILTDEYRGAYMVWNYALLILLQTTVVQAKFFVILRFSSVTLLKYNILCKIYSNHCIIAQNIIPNTVILYVSLT